MGSSYPTMEKELGVVQREQNWFGGHRYYTVLSGVCLAGICGAPH